MSSPYLEQWGRIMDLFKAGRVPRKDLDALTIRHDKWFRDQQRLDATVFMVQDLTKFADHVEQFETKESA